mmetsp:Transcript_28285/g.39330  ORF Transcript_28285/g.39330 Transcript_28285/m.39330 type:complete len:383 (-) Transcript_28285:99-1247(-)
MKQDFLSFQFNEHVYNNDRLAFSFAELKALLERKEPDFYRSTFLETQGLRHLTKFYRNVQQLKDVHNQWWVTLLIKTYFLLSRISKTTYPVSARPAHTKQKGTTSFRLQNPLRMDLDYALTYKISDLAKTIEELFMVKEGVELDYNHDIQVLANVPIADLRCLDRLYEFSHQHGFDFAKNRWGQLHIWLQDTSMNLTLENGLTLDFEKMDKSPSRNNKKMVSPEGPEEKRQLQPSNLPLAAETEEEEKRFGEKKSVVPEKGSFSRGRVSSRASRGAGETRNEIFGLAKDQEKDGRRGSGDRKKMISPLLIGADGYDDNYNNLESARSSRSDALISPEVRDPKKKSRSLLFEELQEADRETLNDQRHWEVELEDAEETDDDMM